MMHAVMNDVEFIQIESERCPYSYEHLNIYDVFGCRQPRRYRPHVLNDTGVEDVKVHHTSKSSTPVQYDGPIKKCTGPPPPSGLGFPVERKVM